MADTYHDIEEMFRYSDHFVTSAASYETLDPFVGVLIKGQKAHLEQLRPLKDQKQASSSSATMSQKDRRALSEETRAALDALFAHLEAAEKKKIVFDFATFFPRRVREDIGKSIADRKGTLERCINGLTLYPQIPDAESLKAELTALHARFAGTVDTTSTHVTTRSQDVKSFNKLRKAWKRHWLACKRGMEAVLLLAEREDELKLLFLDLQVPTKKKKAESEKSKSSSSTANGEAAPSTATTEAAPATTTEGEAAASPS